LRPSPHSQAEFDAELEGLLSEAPAAAADRSRTTFDRLAGSLSERLLLFGAGGLGRRILAGLRRLNVEPLAFADNNPALWETCVEGLPALSPQEAARRFGEHAVFVVTIWNAQGRHRLAQTRTQLESLGCRTVVSFAALFWRNPETFLPYYALDLPQKILPQAEEIRATYSSWADEPSRREFLAQLRWRLRLDFDGLPSPVEGDQYFPAGLYSLSSNEVFVDCGAYDGDTIRAFLARRAADFAAIIGLEPDPVNFARLEAEVARLPPDVRNRIDLHRVGVGERREKARFEASGLASSSVTETGSTEVELAPLDELLRERSPTLIKMDIEGSEPEALAGARGVIERASPVLAVCVYHQQNHLWRIPALIRSFDPCYRLYLRPHGEEGWDLVCYAVPPSREVVPPPPGFDCQS
jgi:FkbM family methyltransferase